MWKKEDSIEQLIKNDGKIDIPEGIKQLDDNCFLFQYYHNYNCYKFRKIIFPKSIETIPKKCIEDCDYLTSITLPLNESQVIIGNKIFNTPHFDQVLYLPNSICKINGKKVNDMTSLTIPTTVTSLDEDCLKGNRNLKYLSIPDSVKSIPNECFDHCLNLETIIIPLNDNQVLIDKTIYTTPHFSCDIELPYSVSVINGEKVPKREYNFAEPDPVFEIPYSVTSLDENCFSHIEKTLRHLIIPYSVRLIPKNCLEDCQGLSNLTIPLNEEHMICEDKIFTVEKHFDQYIYLPEHIRYINGIECYGLKSLEIPTTITSLDENCLKGCDYLTQLTIPESVKSIPSDTLLNSYNLEELTIPSRFIEHGNSLKLPSSIKKINGKSYELLPSIESEQESLHVRIK